MKTIASMILFGGLIGLSSVFSVRPAVAQDNRTTASEVMDRETLKAFVLSARDHLLSINSIVGFNEFRMGMQEEGGDWNYKYTYLVVLKPDGSVFLHGEDSSKVDENLIEDEDDNEKKVVQEILTALESEEEVFVEYTWDDPSTDEDVNPRDCYAIKISHPLLLGREFVLAGGYHVNVSSMGGESEELPELPEVSARDIRDRETLKAFVRGAGNWALGALKALSSDLSMLAAIFRDEGGHWRHGSTYIFAMTPGGDVFFHGARPDQEDQIQIDLEDRNGFKFIKALIDAAVAGGGYVEYFWDDPGVIGDEEFGSAKVGYAETFTVPDDVPIYAGRTVVVGSGFYKGNQVALDFSHFGNGDSVISDLVLVNVADQPVRPAIYFYDEAGELIDPGLVVDFMGNLGTTDYGALILQSELPPLGELTISTNGRGETVSGSVKVVSDGPDSPIGGVLRYDLPGIGVAGVGASQPVRDAIFPARSQEGGIRTGVALRNLSESELMLTCRLMKDGEELEDQPVTLPANGQDAMFIDEMFEYDTSDFTGSVRCTAPAGEQEFTGVAVELDAANRIFTTLPVVPVEERTDRE